MNIRKQVRNRNQKLTNTTSKLGMNLLFRFIYEHLPDSLIYTLNSIYEGESKSFRTESITKYTITINTRWEATQSVMAAKLTRLIHRIAIQLHLVAESCTICSSLSRGQSGNFWIRPPVEPYGYPDYVHESVTKKKPGMWNYKVRKLFQSNKTLILHNYMLWLNIQVIKPETENYMST
jgi:hypothetical protein